MAKKTEKETPQAAIPSPEEKAMSETLAKEMQPKETTPTPTPTASPATAPAPEESKPDSTESIPTNGNPPEATSEEKPKKMGFLHLKLPFSKKKQPEPEIAATPEAQQLTNDALMEMIDEKLSKISGDEFITIKISKSGLLFIIGVILVVVWILTSSDMFSKLPNGLNISKIPTVKELSVFNFNKKEVPPSTPVPFSVRVRMGSESTEEGEAIKDALIKAGLTTVDIVKDLQVNPNQVLVVTRQGDEDLRAKLFNLFAEKYTIASEAATLTEDSDFAATILVGKSALLKK